LKTAIKDYIKLVRPLQWIKNAFVFVGVIFGNLSGEGHYWSLAAVVFVAFCMVSSAVYVFNDLIDCEQDKVHPKKKHRPIAAGRVSKNAALVVAALMGISGLLLGFSVSGAVLAILIGYLALNTAYTLKLKHIVLLDAFCISLGFMLRIFAGTFGLGIPPSQWLLMCGMMLTLFLAFAKRRAEILSTNFNQAEHRAVLDHYGPIFLDEIMAISAACTVIAYSLYTMSVETIFIHQTDKLIYTVPFVIYGLFRYIYLLHHKKSGGDPTRDLLADPHIITTVVAWLALTLYLI